MWTPQEGHLSSPGHQPHSFSKANIQSLISQEHITGARMPMWGTNPSPPLLQENCLSDDIPPYCVWLCLGWGFLWDCVCASSTCLDVVQLSFVVESSSSTFHQILKEFIRTWKSSSDLFQREMLHMFWSFGGVHGRMWDQDLPTPLSLAPSSLWGLKKSLLSPTFWMSLVNSINFKSMSLPFFYLLRRLCIIFQAH